MANIHVLRGIALKFICLGKVDVEGSYEFSWRTGFKRLCGEDNGYDENQ